MSSREMNNLDPKNIIDPNAPVAITRRGNASWGSSPMLSAPPRNRYGSCPDISPIKAPQQGGGSGPLPPPPPRPPANLDNIVLDPDHPVDPAQTQPTTADSIGNQIISVLPSIADELNKYDSPQVVHQEFDRKLKLSFEQLVATVGIHTNKFVGLEQKMKQVEGALKIVQDNGIELENQVNAFNPKIQRLEEGIKQFAVAVEDKFDEHIDRFTQVSEGVDAIISDLKVTQTQVSAQKESVEKVASDVKYIGIVLKSTTGRTTQLEKGQKKVVRKLTEMVQGPNHNAPPPSCRSSPGGYNFPPPFPPTRF